MLARVQIDGGDAHVPSPPPVPSTGRSIAHGIANQATTVMIRARAAITMIAHSVTQIANGTRRFRCMFVKRGEVFYTIQKTSRAMRRAGLPVRSPKDVVPTIISERHRQARCIFAQPGHRKSPARERGSVWSIHRYGLAGEVAKISDTVLARAGGRRG